MLLLDADDEMIMLQKRQIFNKYFCSAFGKKKDDALISHGLMKNFPLH